MPLCSDTLHHARGVDAQPRMPGILLNKFLCSAGTTTHRPHTKACSTASRSTSARMASDRADCTQAAILQRSDQSGCAACRLQAEWHSVAMESDRPPPAGPGRPPPAPHLAPAAVALVLLLLMWAPCALAMCPPKCACDDEALSASCPRASLEVVPIQLNPEARSINLQGNRIVALQTSFHFYSNLRWLDLSRNRIHSLGPHSFQLQDKLVHLNLSANEVSMVHKEAFSGLRSLLVLDLSENLLESLPAAALTDSPDLAELYLASNRLLSVADRAFEHLGQLRVLRLDNNQLLEVPAPALRRLPALKLLGLADNLLEVLDEDSLPALRHLRALYLQGNLISRVHRVAFDGLPALQVLNLSENNLTCVPTASLAKLSRLSDLDLSGNSLQELEPVAFQSLFELRRLRVSRIPGLRRVDPRAFADNVRLESVALDDTGLTSLPSRLFHDRRELVEISVRGNGFTSLDASQFPLDQLRVLALAGNPLHCNCSLLWLWLLTRRQRELEQEMSARNASSSIPNTNTQPDASSSNTNTNTNVANANAANTANAANAATPHLDVDGIRCAQPDALRNTLVVDVPESDVRCDASWLSVIIVVIVVLTLFAGTCGLLLLAGQGRWCRRGDDTEASASLPAHSHLQNGTVLMLMTSKESTDPMDGVVLRAKDMPPFHRFPPDAWDAPCKETAADGADAAIRGVDYDYDYELPPYALNGASTPRKAPHIVYV